MLLFFCSYKNHKHRSKSFCFSELFLHFKSDLLLKRDPEQVQGRIKEGRGRKCPKPDIKRFFWHKKILLMQFRVTWVFILQVLGILLRFHLLPLYLSEQKLTRSEVMASGTQSRRNVQINKTVIALCILDYFCDVKSIWLFSWFPTPPAHFCIHITSLIKNSPKLFGIGKNRIYIFKCNKLNVLAFMGSWASLLFSALFTFPV